MINKVHVYKADNTIEVLDPSEYREAIKLDSAKRFFDQTYNSYHDKAEDKLILVEKVVGKGWVKRYRQLLAAGAVDAKTG